MGLCTTSVDADSWDGLAFASCQMQKGRKWLFMGQFGHRCGMSYAHCYGNKLLRGYERQWACLCNVSMCMPCEGNASAISKKWKLVLAETPETNCTTIQTTHESDKEKLR